MDSEEFFSGYCRMGNKANSVCCEYAERDGQKVLVFMDCCHETCLYTANCEIYKEAHKIERL